MTENTTPEYRAELSALNHEIYRLNNLLEEKERDNAHKSIHDCEDPFKNPTEYRGYSGDYSEILPEITDPSFEIPLEPDYSEKRRIKRSYAIGGGCVFIRFAAADWIASLLIILISHILIGINPDADGNSIITYMKGSAIFASVNMLVYLLANVLTALAGLKLARIKASDLVKTRNYSPWSALHHCLIAIFLLLVSILASDFIEDIFTHYGSTTNVLNLEGTAVTSMGAAIMMIYRCIIAPVTEEFFFRGMLLKTFSRANQRFGVFATAVFFGLAHANIPQFILAFIIGIFLAHITLKHNSIIPAIVVHIFVNSFTNITSMLNLSGVELGIFNMIYVTLAALGAIMFVIFRISDKIPSPTPKQSRRGLSVASVTFIVASAFWLQVIYMMSYIVDNPILNYVKEII